MARSNKTNSEYPPYIGRRRPVAELGSAGLSVFRGFEISQFENVFKTLEEELGGVAIRVRGQGMEKPPGVSLLELSEVKRQKALGHVSVKNAINELYESIGSLRHGITARPSRIQFIGRQGHKSKSLVSMFEEDTESQLVDERARILEVLEGMAATPYDFSWLEYKRPLISLAHISSSQIEKATFEKRYRIEQSLPQTLDLRRATIYNPTHS